MIKKRKVAIMFISALCLSFFMQACNSHPRDKTHLDDIVHCGFGKEYVNGYTRSDGREVDGYCRESN